MNVPCDHCSKIFQIFPYKLKRQKNAFCSTVCQYAFKKRRVSLICRICSTPFDAQKCRVNNQKECFCSKACADIAIRKPRLEKKCLNCGEVFKYLESRTKHTNVSYCSERCCKEDKKPSDNRKCRNCEATFSSKKSQVKSGRGKYCSKSCYSSHAVGENSTKFKHGFSVFKHIDRSIIDSTCSVCRKIRKLDIHHIDGDGFNNSTSNHIAICRSCHMRTHSISGKHVIDLSKALTVLRLIIDLPKAGPATERLVQQLVRLSLEPVDGLTPLLD